MPQASIKKHIFRTGAARRIPVSGSLELTPRCNLCCQMCYIRLSEAEQRARGDELSAQQWIALGQQAADAGTVYLLLTGGEPLLRPEFPQIYTALVRMGMLVSVNTNGTLINDSVAACFARHPPEKVNVTLYGSGPASYASLCGSADGYAAAVDGIRRLRAAGIRVVLNTTFTRCNSGDMEEIVAFARREGIPIRTASYTFPPVRSGRSPCSAVLTPEEHGALNAQFDFLTMEPDKLHRRAAYIRRCAEADAQREADTGGADAPESRASACMAGKGSFWISWNGDMYPCGMLSDFARSAVGRDFGAVWREICDATGTIRLPGECAVCAYRALCPSCAAVTQTTCGDTAVKAEAMCRYTKAYCRRFRELVPHVAEGEEGL